MHTRSLLLLLALAACSDPSSPGEEGSTGTPAETGGTTQAAPTTGDTPSDTTTADPPTSTSDATTGDPTTDPSGDPTTDGTWTPSQCYAGWDQLADFYPAAGTLVDCEGPGYTVQRSLLVVDGITIDNDGTPMNPCVAARCDADHAYIASNTLPHYDFVPITPNALEENDSVLAIPLVPTLPGDDVTADAPEVQEGCLDALDQYLDDPDVATTREPSGLCFALPNDAAYLRETLESGATSTTAKINCGGTTAMTINGVVIAGPNEGAQPDPYGNPLFYMPDLAGDPYIFGPNPALDLCGGHTGGTMHYHGANEACFEQAADGTPANSYATASQAWNLAEMLTGECTAPSPIIGWSPDGYPIKGPCVCTDADCTTVKRARSAWVYRGLGAWGDAVPAENDPCTVDDDCCAGQDCDLKCSPVLVDSNDPDGSAVESRCTLLDYSWCTHQYVDRSVHPGGDGFVYLDRCNGYDGPGGYAYHATLAFPYMQGCYRGVPSDIPMIGGGMGEGPMDEGMDPPMCMNGMTMMCCGDGNCDGPETADNCPEDCG